MNHLCDCLNFHLSTYQHLFYKCSTNFNERNLFGCIVDKLHIMQCGMNKTDYINKQALTVKQR